MKTDDEINEITKAIITSAIRIHRVLGPGVFESVYEAILARDLTRRGLLVERQKVVAFEFEAMQFKEGFRVDLLVESAVIVEVKASTELSPVHARQLLTYLRLMNLRVGLLLNFGALFLRDGIKRISN